MFSMISNYYICRRPNEDLFFSFIENYNYCSNINLHKVFSVETQYCDNPIGIHKIYNIKLNDNEFNNILSYINNNLITANMTF